jgi:exoribonuclease II
MNPKYFADIEWSKKLADHFQDAEWWWHKNKILDKIFLGEKFTVVKDDECECIAPAIHTSLAMEKLSKERQEKAFYNYMNGENTFVNYLCEEIANELCSIRRY